MVPEGNRKSVAAAGVVVRAAAVPTLKLTAWSATIANRHFAPTVTTEEAEPEARDAILVQLPANPRTLEKTDILKYLLLC